MSSNSLKMTVYDKEGYETGDVDSTISLEKDKWYNVLIQRWGRSVTTSLLHVLVWLRVAERMLVRR